MKRLYDRPYLLLVLTVLFWSGNFVLARLVRAEVPPIGLSFWRWAIATLVLLPFVWRDMYRHWPLVRRHLGLLLMLSLFGVASFNTLVYLGLQSTTASNGVLLQSIVPLLILPLAWLILGSRVSLLQTFGILLSLAGVSIIITRGELAVLQRLEVTRGDLWILAAAASWALYTVLLRRLPREIGGVSLLGYTVLFGTAAIAPFYLWEMSQGVMVQFNRVTIGSVLYVALFPSLLAYLFWNRAVAQVGPVRAGQFAHLMPVFGSLLAMLLLDERLYGYHLLGISLVALGIYVATVLARSD